MAARAGEVSLQEFSSENLSLGPQLPDSYKLEEGWKYLPAFYDACAKENIQLGFPVGTLVDFHNLRRGLWHRPSHYFYRLSHKQYPDYFIAPAVLMDRYGIYRLWTHRFFISKIIRLYWGT